MPHNVSCSDHWYSDIWMHCCRTSSLMKPHTERVHAVMPDTVHSHMHRSKTHISNVLCLNVWGGVCSQSITDFMLHHIIFWFNYFLHDFRSFFFTLSWFVKYSNCKKVSFFLPWLYVQFTFSTSVIMFLYVCCHAHTPDSHTSQRKVECGNVTACHSLTNVLLLCHSRLMYASFCFLGSQHHSSTSFPPSGSSHSG